MPILKDTQEQISHLLNKHKHTLSFAESCTGGLLSNILTNQEGSSSFFLGAVICYSNAVKSDPLQVPSSLLEEKGAFNLEVAHLMAKGVRTLLRSDWSLSITGVLSEDSVASFYNVPVGSVFVSIQGPQTEDGISLKVLKGTREEKKKEIVLSSLNFLLTKIRHYDIAFAK